MLKMKKRRKQSEHKKKKNYMKIVKMTIREQSFEWQMVNKDVRQHDNTNTLTLIAKIISLM